MGQYSGGAPHDIYSKMSPLFSGLGWSNVVIQIYTSVYYNLLLAWAIRYLFASFTTKLPWTTCDNEWNTQNCLDDRKMAECTNGTFYANGTCHDEVQNLFEYFYFQKFIRIFLSQKSFFKYFYF